MKEESTGCCGSAEQGCSIRSGAVCEGGFGEEGVELTPQLRQELSEGGWN